MIDIRSVWKWLCVRQSVLGKFALLVSAALLVSPGAVQGAGTGGSGPALVLRPGDRVALIGNALADRMQHAGYFETLVHARFPGHELVVRNLAVAGDEVVMRHRSENFGSPDDWLRKVGADVVLAFFGFNESFRGEAGLEGFRADLLRVLEEMSTADYSGRGAARVVLVSPIAQERHGGGQAADWEANNRNLKRYAEVMAEVAGQLGVRYVDLLGPSLAMYEAATAEGRTLTVNGLHLTDEGYRRLAPVFFERVFDERAPEGDFEPLRLAVNDKNWQWHQRL